MNNIKVHPFLKWAGGKRWLTEKHLNLFPKFSGTYYEPFLGSGAVFFSLAPKSAILSDLNVELIETYKAIKSDWASVERVLKEHHARHSADYYYSLRSSKPRTPHTKAARFIYLNRTCWNGLYRVNLKGQFNVPVGTKTNVILDTDNFKALSNRLNNTDFIACDFEQTIDKAGEGDLIFADPPYTVKHNLNGFIKYNEKIFSWDDQERLSLALKRASNRGSLVISTNAYHPAVKELYSGEFNLLALNRSSVIAASSSFRGVYEELLVTNFDIAQSCSESGRFSAGTFQPQLPS
ncbi:DNA adenine methylase [Stutzerimonas frequens]